MSDLRRSEGLFLTSGPLAESIMASCAIPMLFSGQQIGGREFHDGGILHSVPLEPSVSDPAIHTIYVHQIKYSAVMGGKQRLGVREAFVNAHRMLDSSLLKRRRQDAERNGKRVIMLETHHPHPGFLQSKTAKKRYFDDGHLTGSISRDSTP